MCIYLFVKVLSCYEGYFSPMWVVVFLLLTLAGSFTLKVARVVLV